MNPPQRLGERRWGLWVQLPRGALASSKSRLADFLDLPGCFWNLLLSPQFPGRTLLVAGCWKAGGNWT